MDAPNKIIEVRTLGPQGPTGPQGPAGPQGPGLSPSSSITTTGFISASTYYGDGSNLTGVATDTGSFIITAYADNPGTNAIIFRKGNGTTFGVTIPIATPSPPPIPTLDTGSFFKNATLVNNTIYFTKGDGKFLLLDLSSLDINPFPYTGSAIISGSLGITGSIGVEGSISASTYYGDGSNLTGINTGSWDGIFTGSAVITGSLNVIGPINATSLTGSLLGTASWSQNSLTASYALSAVSPSLAIAYAIALG
jgi:hypothetical protein